MRSFYLYFLFSYITGSPLAALILVLLAYGFVDKVYFGFLPDFSRIFRTNRQIKNNLRELQLNPENAHGAFTLGVLYFEKRKYGEALKYFQHPKLEGDHSADFYRYLGMTHMALKHEEEGRNFLLKALELDPRVGYGLPYIYLLENEMNQKSPDKDSVSELEENIERFSNTENLYRTGMIYKKLGKKEKSKEFFSKALVEYSYCPRGIKRIHRKWAILSKVHQIFG